MEERATVPARITVVLVDDHDLTREGAKQILEDDPCIEVVGEAAGSEEAISLVSELQPSVVVLDIRLKQGSGLDVVRASAKAAPKTRILVLSAYDDEGYVKPLVRLGVHGYLVKTVSAEEFKKAVHDVAEGDLVFPREIAGSVLGVLRNETDPRAVASASGGLTSRESEVLGCIGHGLTNREIAEKLDISLKTVEAHVRHLLSKLGVTSRTQAVLAAFKTDVGC